jgi:flagellar biosynthesis protein FlhF
MRIKRFIAPDMRTALRMVRDEQGPDAVILSNRPTPEGIEVVAATDYDEALVQQALRAATPGLAETAMPAAANVVPMPAPPSPARRETAAPAFDPRRATSPSRAEAMIAALSATPARDSVAARARAVFRVDASAAQAEAASAAASKPAPPAARPQAPALASLLATSVEDEPMFTAQDFAAAHAAPVSQAHSITAPGDDFRALLARLNAAEEAENAARAGAGVPSPALQAADAVVQPVTPAPAVVAVAPATVHAEAATPVTPAAPAAPAPQAATAAASPTRMVASPAPAGLAAAPVEPASQPATAATPLHGSIAAPVAAASTVLHAVATPAEDPALVAMHAELSAMRELMERQMDQLAIERLRGSAGRAHAFDTLVAYGCDEGVAQSVASRIDARLAPEDTREPMFAELARMLVTNRAEPIDDGGVIALVGPTGAGKTTTVAKLAARFAARHRARDVALVTTDTERAGAREQLHALGRRLGITVCEAEGPEALNRTLDQLADYPLVLVDTAGYAARDRALLSQILWLRTARRVRSLLVLPANAHPHDLAEVIRRYRPAAPEGVVLTKTDETGRLGAALSVLVKQDLSLAYTTSGQQVPGDIEAADPARLVAALEKLRRAADNPLMTEDRHAVA